MLPLYINTQMIGYVGPELFLFTQNNPIFQMENLFLNLRQDTQLKKYYSCNIHNWYSKKKKKMLQEIIFYLPKLNPHFPNCKPILNWIKAGHFFTSPNKPKGSNLIRLRDIYLNNFFFSHIFQRWTSFYCGIRGIWILHSMKCRKLL